MPLPPELPPSPMPGAKPSGGKEGDPRASTDKATDAEEAAANRNTSEAQKPDPERGNKMADHLKSFFNVAGKEPASAGGKTAQQAADEAASSAPQTPVEAASQGVAQAPGNTTDY